MTRSRSSMPSPVAAPRWPPSRGGRRPAPRLGPWSALLNARISGIAAGPDLRQDDPHGVDLAQSGRPRWRRRRGPARSASATSSRVDLKASTTWWGSLRTKPTVSVRSNALAAGQLEAAGRGIQGGEQAVLDQDPGIGEVVEQGRLAGVRVADDRHLGDAGAVLGLVLGVPLRRMSRSWRSRWVMLRWMRRRSISNCVSPGPRRVPMPPACWESRAPLPRRRGSRYRYWASSTCALPSWLWAFWAKMSRITAVRSMAVRPSSFSRLSCWAGVSSSSKTTVSQSVSRATSRSSSALPLPM